MNGTLRKLIRALGRPVACAALLGSGVAGATEIVQRDFVVVERRQAVLQMDASADAPEVADYFPQTPEDTLLVLSLEGDYYRVLYRTGETTAKSAWLQKDRTRDAFIVRDLYSVPRSDDDAVREERLTLLAQHPEWGAVQFALAHSGQFRIGAVPEVVRASLGIPNEANKFRTAASEYEQWIYSPGADTSYVLNFKDNALANLREVVKPPSRDMPELEFRSRQTYPYRRLGLELTTAGVMFLGGAFMIYNSSEGPAPSQTTDAEITGLIFLSIGIATEALGIYLLRYTRNDKPKQGAEVSMHTLRDGAQFSLRYHF